MSTDDSQARDQKCEKFGDIARECYDAYKAIQPDATYTMVAEQVAIDENQLLGIFDGAIRPEIIEEATILAFANLLDPDKHKALKQKLIECYKCHVRTVTADAHDKKCGKFDEILGECYETYKEKRKKRRQYASYDLIGDSIGYSGSWFGRVIDGTTRPETIEEFTILQMLKELEVEPIQKHQLMSCFYCHQKEQQLDIIRKAQHRLSDIDRRSNRFGDCPRPVKLSQ